MIFDRNSEYFQIPIYRLDDEIKDWICLLSKQCWYYRDKNAILVETNLLDGIMFRLKFSEKMFG
jgi:hypothetical protein